jgi:hypothetical protein
MKRVRPAALLGLLLLLPAPGVRGGCPRSPAEALLPWVSCVREAAGSGPVAVDPLLERAAGDYAAALAARGVLSHRDPQGRNALDRVQAAGGTTTLVGEILGSGIAPAEIRAAWASSRTHREVVESPLWTHVGVGCAATGSRQVWVVLFGAARIKDLRIEELRASGSARGFRVSGRLPPGQSLQPVLLSGFVLLEPELWSPRSGRFQYVLPGAAAEVYHRLGYQDAEGDVTITDVFYPGRVATSSPETVPR